MLAVLSIVVDACCAQPGRDLLALQHPRVRPMRNACGMRCGMSAMACHPRTHTRADIQYNPVVVSYAFVGLHDAVRSYRLCSQESRALHFVSSLNALHSQYLFVDSKKLSEATKNHCADIGSGPARLNSELTICARPTFYPTLTPRVATRGYEEFRPFLREFTAGRGSC